MTFNHSFGPLTSATAVTAAFPSSVIGKTIIITGVSPDSLGLATALAFASQKPKQLILTGRSEDNVQSSIKSLRSEYPNVQYHALIMDLASQASVRTAAAKVNDDDGISAIDILVNNAGVMAIPRLTLSEDGIETTFATNHIGHFLFTNLIMPKIISASKLSPDRQGSSTSVHTDISSLRFVSQTSISRSSRRNSPRMSAQTSRRLNSLQAETGQRMLTAVSSHTHNPRLPISSFRLL